MLTFTLNGTPGDDLIQVSYDQSDDEYQFTLNGQPAGVTSDPNVSIDALAGHDTVMLYHVADSTSILLLTGIGNDRVEVGNGSLAGNLRGEVTISDAGGLDELIANDSLDHFLPDSPVTFGTIGPNFAIFSSPSVGDPGSVRFTPVVENVHLLCSDGNDTVYVENAKEGTLLSLSGGNDTVFYGDRSNRQLQEVMPPATVVGGAGADRVVFDDWGEVARQDPIYEITPDRFLNQMLSSVEDVELTTRQYALIVPNVQKINMSGSGGALNSITFRGQRTTLAMGSPTPIDLDNLALHVHVEFGEHGHYTVSNEDADNSGAPWHVYRSSSPATQWLAKGSFSAAFRVLDPDEPNFLNIYGGSTPDTFEVSGVVPGIGAVNAHGQGGDDVFYTTNFNGADNDLDAVFPDNLYESGFVGGEGDDFLDLDDSADQINDGDAEYRTVGGLSGPQVLNKGGVGIVDFDEVERINLIADADHNTIYFSGNLDNETKYFVNGNDGNDYITNSYSSLGYANDATVSGGLGTDTLAIVDMEGSAHKYSLSANTFSYENFFSAEQTWLYDSFENFTLDASEVDSTLRINSKPAAMSLTVSARGGIDTLIVGGGDIDASGISSSTTTLLGGAGEDQIVFDDQFDDHDGAFDDDDFDFYPQQVNKDGTTIVYSAFESQKLITSGVNTSGAAWSNHVRINSIGIPTEIEGSAGVRDNRVDVNNLDLIYAPITLSFADANVVASVFGYNSPGARTYNLSAAQMSLPVVVNYVGVEDMYVYAGASNDTLNANGTPTGMNIVFNGGNGDEFMYLGTSGSPLADLAGRVFAYGGDGIDRLSITNGTGGGFTDGLLTTGSFRANGGPNHLYSTVEVVNVTVNGNGSNINVTSLSVSAGISGGSGDDLVTIGAGDLDVNILSTLFVFGAGGSDRVVIDDTNGTNQPGTPTEYLLDVFHGAAGPVDRLQTNPASAIYIAGLEVEQREFNSSNDPNTINVVDTLGDLRINSNGGNDVVNVTDATGLVTLDTGSGSDAVTVNSDSGTSGDGPVTVLCDRSDAVSYLDVRAGGTLRVSPGAALAKESGFFQLTGVIDLAGGALLARAGGVSQATLRTFITRGYNSGSWNGTGSQGAINSSLAAGGSPADAVGYGLGSEIAISSIGSFTINANDTLVRYTLYGDADLNARVDFDDYVRTDLGFNTGRTGWTNGDFDYNNSIDFDDYFLIDLGFNSQQRAIARLTN